MRIWRTARDEFKTAWRSVQYDMARHARHSPERTAGEAEYDPFEGGPRRVIVSAGVAALVVGGAVSSYFGVVNGLGPLLDRPPVPGALPAAGEPEAATSPASPRTPGGGREADSPDSRGRPAKVADHTPLPQPGKPARVVGRATVPTAAPPLLAIPGIPVPTPAPNLGYEEPPVPTPSQAEWPGSPGASTPEPPTPSTPSTPGAPDAPADWSGGSDAPGDWDSPGGWNNPRDGDGSRGRGRWHGEGRRGQHRTDESGTSGDPELAPGPATWAGPIAPIVASHIWRRHNTESCQQSLPLPVEHGRARQWGRR